MRSLRSFRKDTEGAATIEFVVVFIFFMAILTFTIEVAIFMFFQTTLEKAAEAGVRVAVVSPSVMNLPHEIPPSADGVRGQRCRPDGDEDNPDPCVPVLGGVGTQSSCGKDAAGPCGPAMDRIVAEMARYNGRITADNVQITYTELGIGFAGGPPVPMVTVTVSGVIFESGVLGLLLNWNNPGASNAFNELPARRASLTAESLGP